MKILKLIICTLLLVTSLVPSFVAQDQGDISIPIDMNQATFINVDIKFGSINIKGSDRDDVYIKWSPLYDNNLGNDEPRADGLKRVGAGAGDMEIEQAQNGVIIDASSFTKGYAFEIEVPSKINVFASSFNEGDVEIHNVEGVHTIESYNGKITANNIRGAITCNTFNGDILVTLDQVTPDMPMAFDTYNGSVDVTLPGDTKASLKMKSKGGEILTGFDFTLKKAKDPEKMESKDGQSRIVLDNWVMGDINGGGPEIICTNNWGDILIRKK